MNDLLSTCKLVHELLVNHIELGVDNLTPIRTILKQAIEYEELKSQAGELLAALEGLIDAITDDENHISAEAWGNACEAMHRAHVIT